jgi:hypothetical protein
MPSLSFDKGKNGKGVAIVKGGDYDNEILYIHDDDMSGGKKPKLEINSLTYAKELKPYKSSERVKILNRLGEALSKDIDVENLIEPPEIKELYKKVRGDGKKNIEITLPMDSHFELLPSSDVKKREVWYVAGASGSGKSYIAKEYAKYYQKLFPERSVYLISKLTSDETLDKIKPKRIDVSTLVSDYPDVEEFRECLVIFDDIDCFTGNTLKAVHQLIDDLAITGRHAHTSIMFLTHYITNYKKTRLILNESTHFVVYPQATSYHSLRYLLKTHIGMEDDEIKHLRKLGRWVCISKNYPQTLIASQYAKLLHQS